MNLPRRNRKPTSQLTDAERGKRLILTLIGQVSVAFMVVVGVIYLAVSIISGATVVIPRTTDGVLKSVNTPDHYAWTSETIRRVNLGGENMEQHASRSVVTDTKLNRSQVVVSGVLPETTTFVTAGKVTRAVTSSNEEQGGAPTVVNRVCKGEPPVAARTALMPSATDLRAASPQIRSDEATVRGQRAWLIEFTPTPQIMRKLLLLDFFDKVTTNYTDLKPWVISTAELDAIKQGKLKVDYARAWVTREGRQLTQFDVKVRADVDGGGTYRLLSTLRSSGKDRPLKSLAAGAVNCNAQPTTTAPATGLAPVGE